MTLNSLKHDLDPDSCKWLYNKCPDLHLYLDVYVVVAPRFEDPAALQSGPDRPGDDTSETAISGEPVRLRCMVHAFPEPQITWYKNGDELRLDDADKYLLSRDGRELHITSVSVDDVARYTCIARNLAGETQRNFDLAVHGLFLSSCSVIIIVIITL